ncbi:Conserved_hypothetical protein [Hexamita inflata]|uniref:MORN repeat protein n=1 Tax=Hexamita inflata TaxID=28002 RepID=A0AA86Q4C8_9EUKA|nr:Conserved hypothetical protein [Hexamita inflata]
MHGKGKLIYKGEEYSGQFVKGKYEGKGVLKLQSGLEYSGEFKNGAFNGLGVCKMAQSEMKGFFVNGKLEGEVSVGGDKSTVQYTNGVADVKLVGVIIGWKEIEYTFEPTELEINKQLEQMKIV